MPRPTVLNGKVAPRYPAAFGGDVFGTDQVAVAGETTAVA